MRINLYDRELKFMEKRIEHVRKEVDGIDFHGFRMYTEAPIMHRPDDDDSSCITIWVQRTRDDEQRLTGIALQLQQFIRDLMQQ